MIEIRRAGCKTQRWSFVTAAVLVNLLVPGCRQSEEAPEPPAAPSSSRTRSVALPRSVIVPLSVVQAVLPEMTQETATGENPTAIGQPTGTRSVTYATANGSQRVVISVDRYPSEEEALSAYDEAVRKSEDVPGASGAPASGLGRKAFIGVVTQGGESHVGGGSLYGERIVNATLQGYAGTKSNEAKVAEVIRKQAAAAEPTR